MVWSEEPTRKTHLISQPPRLRGVGAVTQPLAPGTGRGVVLPPGSLLPEENEWL